MTDKLKILVTGGAGYIGSHIVKLLGENTNHDIVVVDNLSTGNREAVLYGHFVHADIADREVMDNLFHIHQFDAVLHFAASIVVPESMSDPIKYYMNNTVNTIALIDRCASHGVKYFIFSSTAAVYGEPDTSSVPIKENHPALPINPYGRSKLMSEWVLQDVANNSNMKFVILRYFNVAGASSDGKIGQSFPVATHLINIAAQTAAGKRNKMSIFGTDYPTPDGTCIRDYIHVEDLALAHLMVLDYLRSGNLSNIFNCGYGHGYSVNEVLAAMSKVCGHEFAVEASPRRSGDPIKLVADSTKLKNIAGWKPRYDDLEFICRCTLNWEVNSKF